jgi:hypothetical protein
MAELEKADYGEAGEPALKRARLESVVPAPAPPPAKQVAKQPPPMPKPVASPLWLSGQLPPKTYYNNRDSGQGGNERQETRGGGWRGGRGCGCRSGRGKN